jgi:hypothetical protein
MEGVAVAQEIFRIPLVSPIHYKALRRLIQDAPPTHAEWVKLFKQREMQESLRGFVIRYVNVYPQKFAEFCRSKGQATNFITLEHFLIETDSHGNQR